MVDTFGPLQGGILLLLLGLWACGQRLGVVHKSTGRRARQLAAAEAGGLVDAAELDVGEANQPFALLGLLDRDRFADQRFADEDEVAAPFDLAVRADATHRTAGHCRSGSPAAGQIRKTPPRKPDGRAPRPAGREPGNATGIGSSRR